MNVTKKEKKKGIKKYYEFGGLIDSLRAPIKFYLAMYINVYSSGNKNRFVSQ
jgi:hypothetical protein